MDFSLLRFAQLKYSFSSKILVFKDLHCTKFENYRSHLDFNSMFWLLFAFLVFGSLEQGDMEYSYYGEWFFFSQGQGETEDCCNEKTLGGVTYLLDRSWIEDPRNTFPCLSSCVYQREGDPESWFCFGPGDQEPTCEEELQPEEEEEDPYRPLFFNMGEEFYDSYEELEHYEHYEEHLECFGHGVLSCREILDLDLLDDVYDDEVIIMVTNMMMIILIMVR